MGCSASNSVGTNSTHVSSNSRRSTGKNKIYLNEPELWVHNPPLSSNKINQMRLEFWHTHEHGTYGGSPENWNSIKSASQALIDGDMNLACSILQAAKIMPQNNSLSKCFDSLGNEYNIPPYCYSRPSALADEENNTRICVKNDSQSLEQAVDLGDSSSEEKIHVRIRTSDGRQDFLVLLEKKLTILDLKRRIQIELSTKSNDTDNIFPLVDAPPIQQRIFIQGKEQANNIILSTLPEGFSFPYKKGDRPIKKNKLQTIQVFVLPKSSMNSK